MGVILDYEKPEVELYSAYGYTVYGKINTYVWTVFEEKEEDCLINVRITKGDDVILNEGYHNNAPLKRIFDKYIDDFLWWIDHDNPDGYSISETFRKAIVKNSDLFSCKIRSRKSRELERQRQEEYQAQLKAKEEEDIAKIKAYCEKKKLVMLHHYSEIILIKYKSQKSKEALENFDRKYYNDLVKFLEEHPDNKDGCIVKRGIIEDVVNYIK